MLVLGVMGRILHWRCRNVIQWTGKEEENRMTLIVHLSPAEDARLRKAARARGVAPEELARQLIAGLPTAESNADQNPQPRTAAEGALPRVSEKLRAMGRKALREHAEGRTEDFPV